MRTTWLAWTISAGLGLGACSGKDDEDTGAATTSGGSSSSSASSSSGESTGDATTGAPPIMVMCEGISCLMGQVCVSPPSVCNYDKMPPEVEEPPAYCADYPPGCVGQTGEMERTCLDDLFCVDAVGPASYDGAGLLDCFPAWYDCF